MASNVQTTGNKTERIWQKIVRVKSHARKWHFLPRPKRNIEFNIHGPVHRNNILLYKSQQDAHVTEFIYLTIALYVSGVTITHLQEHKTTVTSASGNRYIVLLSATIVEDLELI
jgi:hypothetical protein